MRKDVTEIVERLEAFEDRLGVRLDGVFASIEGPDSDGEYTIQIAAEVHTVKGTTLKDDLTVVASAYDKRGRVVGTENNWFSASSFFAFDTFEITLYARSGPVTRNPAEKPVWKYREVRRLDPPR